MTAIAALPSELATMREVVTPLLPIVMVSMIVSLIA